MMSNQNELPQQLVQLAAAHSEVVVLWLYGSRAKGNAASHSDWDLAIAFDPVKLPDVLDNRLRPELLALEWQRALGLSERQLSIVDIHQAPIPLAFAASDANCLLYCRDVGRRLQEEGRIMSRMELDYPLNTSIQTSAPENTDGVIPAIAGNTYITALSLDLETYQAEQLELRTLLAQRALSNLEYRAAERSLQVTIEACIGIAKHWSKELAGHSPQDAYQAFEILAQRGVQPPEALRDWRRIVGLRNALVHDYLNINPEIIRSVIAQGYSDQLFEFARQGLWIMAHGEEFFMSYEQFPWFRTAPVAAVFNVEPMARGGFHWPDLDVDLHVDILRNPEKYPLIAKTLILGKWGTTVDTNDYKVTPEKGVAIMLPSACVQIRQALLEVPFMAQISNQADYEKALSLMNEMIDDYDTNKSLIDILSVSIERWENQSDEFASFNAELNNMAP